MEKLSLEKFLSFAKDKDNNIENFKSWGLYPNEDPTKVVETKGKKEASKKNTTDGSYNY